MREKNRLTAVIAVSAVLCAVAFYLYTLCGAPAVGALYVWIAAFFGIYLPGIVIKDVFFGKKAEGVEFTVTAVGGFAFFALATLVSSATTLHFVLPLLVVAMGAVYIRIRLKNKKSHRKTDLFGIGAAVAVASVLVLLNGLWAVRYAHPIAVGQLTPSQDFFWNLGNAQSILMNFPVADLRVSGVTVSYHFLTELLQAGLCMLTGLGAYNVVAFYSYGPVALAMTGCLFELGRLLWKNCRARQLAMTALPLVLGCASLFKVMENGVSRFGNSIAIHTVSNINGQATAFFALAAFFVLFHRYFQGENHTGGLVLTGCAFFLLTFSKSPQGAIVAIALALALVVAKLTKQLNFDKNRVIFSAVVVVGFAVVYALYFSAGADSSMAFSLTGTVKNYWFANILNLVVAKFPSVWQVFLPVIWAAQAFLMAPAFFAVWVCGAVYDLFHIRKLSVMRLMLHACIVGGFAAFFIFEHYSSSQVYFASLALFCMAVLAMDMAGVLMENHSGAKKILAAASKAVLCVLCAVGILSNGFFVLWLGTTAGDCLDGSATKESHIPLTAAEEAACILLRQNMEEDMYFATNRMHTGTALEGLSNVYSGLLGRQAYCESFKYAVSNMGDQGGQVYEKYEMVSRLFEEESREQIEVICKQLNIHYIIYNPMSPGSDKSLEFMPVVFEQDGIKIYKAQ
ncbi:MAG: hypothetical protein IKV52_05280 [Oscillospiraceae bacterium]|nr:hypothetical protein [Oscillospiraceae bacterium]